MPVACWTLGAYVRDVAVAAPSPLRWQRYVEYTFTSCYYLPAVLAILAMLRWGERASIRVRMQLAFGLDALLMLVVPAFACAGTFDWDPRGGTPDDAWVPSVTENFDALSRGCPSHRRAQRPALELSTAGLR